MINLVAFKCESEGYYNVWRFSPKTECVAFMIKAESEEDAIKKARGEQ